MNIGSESESEDDELVYQAYSFASEKMHALCSSLELIRVSATNMDALRCIAGKIANAEVWLF